MQDKTICILSHAPIANDSRVLKIIRYFSDKDFYCQVIYPVTNKKNALPGNLLKNVEYTPVLKKNMLSHKLLRHTFFPFEFNYLTASVKKKLSFSHIYVNDLPALYAGKRIKELNPGSLLIYDSHEIYNETVNQFFPVKSNLVKSLIFKFLIAIMKTSGYYIEKILTKKVDLFITVNESLKAYFERKYKLSDIKVVMNCPALHPEKNIDEPLVSFRKIFDWKEGDIIYLYQGELNEGRGLKLIIKSFSVAPPDCKLVIMGKGVLEESLKELINQYQLHDKVKLFGFVDQHLLQSHTKAADVGINLLEPFNLSKAMASPNKLFEYIHAGIPVICSNTHENRKVLDNFDVGILIENTLQNILDGILYFTDISKIDEKKNDILLAKEYYSWEKQKKVLDKFFK